MRLVSGPTPLSELKKECMTHFSTMIKAVVDVSKAIMAVDAELHADQEAFLLEQGSNQADLWGINIYPEKVSDEFIEFTSLINIRPSQENPSMEVLDPAVRERIVEIVGELINADA
jgi:hypothetical protein